MGWLSRLFPGSKKTESGNTAVPVPAPADAASIPPAKVGLNGEFDESGLAKRVALAFDNDATLDDIETLWVAQLSGKVMLKGKVPSQALLDKAVSIASGVSGAEGVDTSGVTIG